MTDVVIIGGGTAGLTAAVYLLRAGKRVLVLESETLGGQITSSPLVENYPGIVSVSGMEFADRLAEQAANLGCEIDLAHVDNIRRESDHFVVTGGPSQYQAGAIILATGTKRRKLMLPNEDALTGHGVSYCAICDGAFFRDGDVAVVGGGSAALQSAMYLAGVCRSVTLIHRRDEFRGEQKLAEKLAAEPKVHFLLKRTIREICGIDRLTSIVVQDAESGACETLPLSGLFVSIGQTPANQSFGDIVELDEGGYIRAAEDCHTSYPGIFAAGDCRTKAIRQLTTAAGDGTVAALAAVDYLEQR